MPTHARWVATWAALDCSPPTRPAPVNADRTAGEPAVGDFDDVIRCYSEPHRAYHTCRHLAECFSHLDGARSLAQRAGEVELALWLHDVVYDPRAADSEARSAAIARAMLECAGATSDVAGRVCELILATRHAAVPAPGDATLLVDIDLSILGAPRQRFWEYESEVRREYAFVPEAHFRAARARVLEGFLARPRIYGTPHFAERLDAQARANLTESLRRLRQSDESSDST